MEFRALSPQGIKVARKDDEETVAADLTRAERLQIMLTPDELEALDTWRFQRRMPSRAAAVRELLKRGLAAEGLVLSGGRNKSQDYGVLDDADLEEEAAMIDGAASRNGSDGADGTA